MALPTFFFRVVSHNTNAIPRVNKNLLAATTGLVERDLTSSDISRKTLQRRIHSLKNKNNNLFDEHI
jgi:hypothetical protein